MATQAYINELNEKIDYEQGKVYWKPNKDWTSKLLESLLDKGYEVKRYPSGLVDIVDKNGKEIVSSEIGMANACFRLAKNMR